MLTGVVSRHSGTAAAGLRKPHRHQLRHDLLVWSASTGRGTLSGRLVWLQLLTLLRAGATKVLQGQAIRHVHQHLLSGECVQEAGQGKCAQVAGTGLAPVRATSPMATMLRQSPS